MELPCGVPRRRRRGESGAGYRTVSHEVAAILAGVPPAPAELIADALMLAETYAGVAAIRLGGGPVVPRTVDAIRATAHRRVLGEWKNRLERSPPETGIRTVEAILPCLHEWMDRRWGRLSFRLTQVLTGHGCFSEYLCRIGKAATTQCHHCEEGMDSAQHTLEHCPA
ncbi:PREDICTED: uncharacterized protein LOC108759034 [Trachymyrmex cornetzi]|uniref:uncharacterized protein LOC108759034 n=1 Tax=Trachymyrmex cornetzi TaxID=471704 RepID=UPI00084F6FFB|nr:PREDICTED: uncharacterized protein LOC108759034 [Trachymyrmex cornetzi]